MKVISLNLAYRNIPITLQLFFQKLSFMKMLYKRRIVLELPSTILVIFIGITLYQALTQLQIPSQLSLESLLKIQYRNTCAGHMTHLSSRLHDSISTCGRTEGYYSLYSLYFVDNLVMSSDQTYLSDIFVQLQMIDSM